LRARIQEAKVKWRFKKLRKKRKRFAKLKKLCGAKVYLRSLTKINKRFKKLVKLSANKFKHIRDSALVASVILAKYLLAGYFLSSYIAKIFLDAKKRYYILRNIRQIWLVLNKVNQLNFKLIISGKWKGNTRAIDRSIKVGNLAPQSFFSDIDFSSSVSKTKSGVFNIKI